MRYFRAALPTDCGKELPATKATLHPPHCRVPNHQTGRSTSLDARYQVARLFNLGYELDLTKCSKEERKEIACSLLADGELSYEKIAKHTGFTVEEIQKLAAQKGA